MLTFAVTVVVTVVTVVSVVVVVAVVAVDVVVVGSLGAFENSSFVPRSSVRLILQLRILPAYETMKSDFAVLNLLIKSLPGTISVILSITVISPHGLDCVVNVISHFVPLMS